MTLNVIIVCVIFSLNFVASDVGDACRPTNDITDGQCAMVTDCEVALRYINEDEKHPFKRCGFMGIMEIVCCPMQSDLDVTTKVPDTTTSRRPKPTTQATIPTRTTRRTTTTPSSPPLPTKHNDKRPTTTLPPPPKHNDKLGDACRPSHNISHGECTLLTNCDTALRIFEKTEIQPFNRCGFMGTFEVICCPKGSINLEPNVTSLLRDKVQIKDTAVSFKPEDKSRIADKQCKKFVNSNVPPSSLHIVGGVNVALGEFPHMVALAYDTDKGIAFRCGASLISETFVLTAAHCVFNAIRMKPSAARIGVVDLGDEIFNPETDIKIQDIFIHPNYSQRSKYNDIALLRLEHPVTFSPSIIPACLYTGETVPTNISLTVTGWGRTSITSNEISKVLQKANVTATSQALCVESYSPWRQLLNGIARGQFCAGDAVNFRDTCQGDSGGPIQAATESDGFYRIMGITSFGRSCGGLTPAVYTEVSVYLDWIESIVWPNGE